MRKTRVDFCSAGTKQKVQYPLGLDNKGFLEAPTGGKSADGDSTGVEESPKDLKNKVFFAFKPSFNFLS